MAPLPLHSPRPQPSAASGGDRIYRPFLRAALWCTLTLGSTFGAFNLLFIDLSLGEVPPTHQWVHGTFQVLGFIQLFIFGIALQMAPRFLGGRLAHPRLAKRIWLLVVAAVLLRSYGALSDRAPGALAATWAGALLELSATGAFAIVMLSTARSGQAPRDGFRAFFLLGACGWIAAAVILCAGAFQAAIEHDGAAAIAWNEAFYLCALFAGALPFTQGVLRRAGAVVLGTAGSAAPPALPIALLIACGALCCVLGVAPSGLGSGWLDAGLLSVSLAVLLSARMRVAAGTDGTAAIVRMALAFSAAFAVLASLYAVLDLASDRAPRLLFDAARHAFGLGFLTVLIFGMAGRIVPAFEGHELRWPRLRFWGAMLVAAGAGLRIVQAVAALTGWEWPLFVSGPSGLVAAAGVALASASVLRTLGSRP